MKDTLGFIFSSDAAVVAQIACVAPYAGAAYAICGLTFPCIGALTGQGRPNWTAVAFLFGAFLFNPLLGWLLGIWANMGIVGIWIALCVGYAVTTATFGAVCMSQWDTLACKTPELL